MMIKKVTFGLAPLLAVAAALVVPAMASAGPVWTSNSVEVGGAPGINIVSKGKGAFVLKAASGNEVTCTGLSDTGTIWNEGGMGKDKTSLTFTGCSIRVQVAPGVFITCKVEVPLFVVTSLLLYSGVKINDMIALPAGGAAIKTTDTSATCEGALGAPGSTVAVVTGETEGEVVGGTISFVNSGGLSVNGEPGATITGEDEQEGESGEVIGAE